MNDLMNFSPTEVYCYPMLGMAIFIVSWMQGSRFTDLNIGIMIHTMKEMESVRG